MPLKSTKGENIIFCRSNVLTKKCKLWENYPNIHVSRQNMIPFICFLTKARKHFSSDWNFDKKKPIFMIMRTWFSFWACASSFSQKFFLFSAVLHSWRINTPAIKCDKLSDDWNFLPASLIIWTQRVFNFLKQIFDAFSIKNVFSDSFWLHLFVWWLELLLDENFDAITSQSL
jgi:hypothetical protein